MTNRISGIVILISITLMVLIATNGISIGNFQILSIEQLIEKNNMLSQKIGEASTLTSESYPNAIKELEQTYNEEYLVQKQKYEELVGTIKDVKEDIYEAKQYDISYLWRVLGRYAQKWSLDLEIKVEKNNDTESSYNFNFTVLGEYEKILKFITDIENDSNLYFRIYNFKIEKEEQEQEEQEGIKIKSTFNVKNINIDESTIS